MSFRTFLPLHTKCPNPEKVPLRQLHTTHHHPCSPLTLEFSRHCSAIHFPYLARVHCSGLVFPQGLIYKIKISMILKTQFLSYFPDSSCNYPALNPLVVSTAKKSVFGITSYHHWVVKSTYQSSNVILS